MALIIEDGTIVSNANSYVTDLEYVTYAAFRGLSIGTDAAIRETELIKSMDYLQNQDYIGLRTEPDNQILPWPRRSAFLYGRTIDSATIPQELKNAQIEGAVAAFTQLLQINEVSQNIASADLDTLSVSFHGRGSTKRIRLDRVNTWLEPLLEDTNKLVRT